MMIRSLFAFLFAVGLVQTNMQNMHNIEIPSVRMESVASFRSQAHGAGDSVRYMSILAFEVMVFVHHTQTMHDQKVAEQFSYIVHVCFIMGGMALEALVSRSRLLADLAMTMLTAYVIGIALDWLFRDLLSWWELASALLLAISIPWKTVPQRGMLAFTVDDFSTAS